MTVGHKLTDIAFSGAVPPGGGTPMSWIVVGMLVVSLIGVNYGFWYPLGYPQYVYSHQGMF